MGVFSSFKSHVGTALNALIRTSEGRVPTTEDIPKIVAEAWLFTTVVQKTMVVQETVGRLMY